MSKRNPEQPADAIEFEVINREIDALLKRLHRKGVCPGMMYRGAFLHQEVAGTEETVSLCMDIVDVIEQPDDDRVSEGQTQH